ncbi:redoxin family protein [Pseudenhygromyxa sp. WMMC2535]|uniref:redoxin family protein n=1 Tax=Pseudenhygromyxa sp. WMMC2535 TaxID=2712867 RepID=UPI001554C1FF|nr:redoxin family protein [Pseudenhygromyxa sp. WMMC2535]NVB40180.1 redoxin family protein [Pseudenhygromyxa sp. WMMC2535]
MKASFVTIEVLAAALCLLPLACVDEPADSDDATSGAEDDATSGAEDDATDTSTDTSTDTAEGSTEDAGTSDTDTSEEGVCVGVAPLIDGSETDADADAGAESSADTDDPVCPDCAPAWALYDFQPQSCGFEQTYGLESFEGHVTLVAMLAGWCSYCQSQAVKMEQLRLELQLEGYDAQFIAINAVSADNADDQQALVDRCAFPLFQDTAEQDAWGLHDSGKDDIFVYAADGTLSMALPIEGDVPTNLSTDEGYAAVKQAIIDAF